MINYFKRVKKFVEDLEKLLINKEGNVKKHITRINDIIETIKVRYNKVIKGAISKYATVLVVFTLICIIVIIASLSNNSGNNKKIDNYTDNALLMKINSDMCNFNLFSSIFNDIEENVKGKSSIKEGLASGFVVVCNDNEELAESNEDNLNVMNDDVPLNSTESSEENITNEDITNEDITNEDIDAMIDANMETDSEQSQKEDLLAIKEKKGFIPTEDNSKWLINANKSYLDLRTLSSSKGFKRCDTSTSKSLVGIDVSSHQGTINWSKVKEAGVDFAMIRVGFRGYGSGKLSVDSQFKRNIEGALSVGIDVGIYFFSQAITVKEAIEEATLTLRTINQYNITYPIAIDTEYVPDDTARTNTCKMTNALRTDICIAYCETIKNAGYIPMIYACRDWLLNALQVSRLNAYDIWYARYADKPGYNYSYTMWQYSETGFVNGITTYVDLNISFKDYGGIKRAEEEARRLEEERIAEEARRLEEERIAAEEARIAEEARRLEEAKRLEEEKKAAEEAKRLEEEKKAAEEAKRLEEEKKAAEEAKRLEEEKK